MNAREICKLQTFHRTKIFYDAKRGVFHAEHSTAPEVLFELTDESARAYVVDGDQRIYFSIDDAAKFRAES